MPAPDHLVEIRFPVSASLMTALFVVGLSAFYTARATGWLNAAEFGSDRVSG
jgi:hypothetical protein